MCLTKATSIIMVPTRIRFLITPLLSVSSVMHTRHFMKGVGDPDSLFSFLFYFPGRCRHYNSVLRWCNKFTVVHMRWPWTHAWQSLAVWPPCSANRRWDRLCVHASCQPNERQKEEKIQDYFIISSEKLQHDWTLTTSHYTITHILYFKTQRTVIENTKVT